MFTKRSDSPLSWVTVLCVIQEVTKSWVLIRSVTVSTLRIVMVFCVSLGGDTVHVSAKRCDGFCVFEHILHC